ncbi:hypothetical protein HanLR1_Chr09g0308621 [Helianthus annuus]|nr:hypothetical protein HanHA89_Chr09g0329181 [Helianthus annuus]KAJ0706578.1 hypothetical protein HanLR1_Chr09g0308621 [Helianthus annuus]
MDNSYIVEILQPFKDFSGVRTDDLFVKFSSEFFHNITKTPSCHVLDEEIYFRMPVLPKRNVFPKALYNVRGIQSLENLSFILKGLIPLLRIRRFHHKK